MSTVRRHPASRDGGAHSLQDHVESNSIRAIQIPAPLFDDRRAVEADVRSRDVVGLWRGLENTALAVFQHDAEPQESSPHRPGLDDTGFKELTAHHRARRASVKAGHAFLLLEHRERDTDDRVATMRLGLECSAIRKPRAFPYATHVCVSRGRRIGLTRRGGGIASRRRGNPNWGVISGRAPTGKRKNGHKPNIRDDAARNHGWSPPEWTCVRTVRRWEIARQGGKTSKAPMSVQNTFVRQTAACSPTLWPVSARLLERRFYCHRAQRPGGVAITLRHASAKTDIQVARNDSQSARKAMVRRNRAEKRQRP